MVWSKGSRRPLFHRQHKNGFWMHFVSVIIFSYGIRLKYCLALVTLNNFLIILSIHVTSTNVIVLSFLLVFLSYTINKNFSGRLLSVNECDVHNKVSDVSQIFVVINNMECCAWVHNKYTHVTRLIVLMIYSHHVI